MDKEKNPSMLVNSGKEVVPKIYIPQEKRKNPFKITTIPRPEIPKKQDLRGKMIRKMKYKGQKNGKWSKDEQERFLTAIKLFGTYWQALQVFIPTRTSGQIRSHSQKYFLGEKRIEMQRLKQEGCLNQAKFFVCKNYRNWNYHGKLTKEKLAEIHKLKEQYFPDHPQPNCWDIDQSSQPGANSRKTEPTYLIREDASLIKLDSLASPAHSLFHEEASVEFKIENEDIFEKDMFYSVEQELSISKNANYFNEEIAIFDEENYNFKEEVFLNEQELI